MIQRIQSVYLLGACLVLTTAASILYVMPEIAVGGYRLVFAGVEAMTGLVALIAIFLFGNRALQATVVTVVRLVNLLLIVVLLYALYATEGFAVLAASRPVLIAGLLIAPVVALVALHLARKAIGRDIDLIRSMDRLR